MATPIAGHDQRSETAEAFIEELLAAMTWEQKLAQLQIAFRPRLEDAKDLARGGIGAVFWPRSAEATNERGDLLFIRDRVASLAQPVRRLRAFARTTLNAGQTKSLRIDLGWSDLGFCDNQGRYVVEPGEFEVHIGGGLENNAHTVVRLT